MRPIWQQSAPLPRAGVVELDSLADVETNAVAPLRIALGAAKRFGVDATSIDTVAEAAETDLSVGCDLARVGYFKQAYALWRSWFEETIFALYFLESPLHRTAWRVIDEIKEPGERQAVELMLHQLLDGQRKHPFHVVYTERFVALYENMKRPIPKGDKPDHPLRQAERCLTDLSQGVHGTYVPSRLSSEAELPLALSKHAVPVLRRTDAVVSAFCFAFVHELLEPNEQQLLEMRNTGYQPSTEEDRLLHDGLRCMDRWFANLSEHQKKDPRRG